MVAAMSTRRTYMGCAVYNQCLYAVGGRNEHDRLASAERYHEKMSRWENVGSLPIARDGVSEGFLWYLSKM